MRRPIGWVDRDCPEGRRAVEVEFFADTLRWRFKKPDDEQWGKWGDGVPTAENWEELEEKVRQLIQRGHIFNKELALVQKLRKGL